MDLNLDRILNLPQTTVESCEIMEDRILMNITLLNQGITCPHCQKYTEEVNQNRPIVVRDLAAFGQRVY